jgi:Tfp pilus assembly protein PilF
LVNPDGYDLYLQARTLHRQRGRGLLEALELFQKALDIDPQFARAWAGLAHAYNDVQSSVPREELERFGDLNAKSMVAAKKALELDPTLATALHAMANSQRRRLEWASAQEYYETALKHDPASADIMEDYAYLLLNSLQLKAAKKVIDRMLALDPYVAGFYGVAIDFYNTLGEFDKRDKYIQTALDINPEIITLQRWNYVRLLQYGELQKAHSYVDQVNQPDSARAEGYHKMIDWMAVQEQQLDKAMQDLVVSRSLFAYVSGNYELWLKSRWRQPEPPSFISFSRVVAPIMTLEESKQRLANPRTHELVQALRLPEYWREVGWPDMCRPVGEHDFVCE